MIITYHQGIIQCNFARAACMTPCVCVSVCVGERETECECDSCVARAVTTDTLEIDTHLYDALTQKSADCLQFKPTRSDVNQHCQYSKETSSN